MRSDLASPRGLDESEGGTPSSDSHGESKSDNERTRKKRRLPKYSFPFLSGRKWKPRSTVLTVPQNKSLHVRIRNTVIHNFRWLLLCNFSVKVFPLYRILWWQASLNVPKSCGRATKERMMWSPLYQQLTWTGMTYLHCQSKFILNMEDPQLCFFFIIWVTLCTRNQSELGLGHVFAFGPCQTTKF